MNLGLVLIISLGKACLFFNNRLNLLNAKFAIINLTLTPFLLILKFALLVSLMLKLMMLNMIVDQEVYRMYLHLLKAEII